MNWKKGIEIGYRIVQDACVRRDQSDRGGKGKRQEKCKSILEAEEKLRLERRRNIHGSGLEARQSGTVNATGSREDVRSRQNGGAGVWARVGTPYARGGDVPDERKQEHRRTVRKQDQAAGHGDRHKSAEHGMRRRLSRVRKGRALSREVRGGEEEEEEEEEEEDAPTRIRSAVRERHTVVCEKEEGAVARGEEEDITGRRGSAVRGMRGAPSRVTKRRAIGQSEKDDVPTYTKAPYAGEKDGAANRKTRCETTKAKEASRRCKEILGAEAEVEKPIRGDLEDERYANQKRRACGACRGPRRRRIDDKVHGELQRTTIRDTTSIQSEARLDAGACLSYWE
ncbi:hypothetical protein R3P38DRAFT_2784381 [Favolaschia claudopus]|uniref:Uncharacterized protein n=1 Tax=Favolaschia claudopus TaxID=2862362 RepID=A0AAW0AZH0_9AGAR